MSSRQDDKEQRRREREQVEKADKRSAARRKRLTIVGVVAAVLLVVAVVAGSFLGGGDSDGDGPETKASIPPQRERNLAEAARAAGCEVREDSVEGREHVSEPVAYKQNPPTSGNHDPVASEDGIYEPGNPPDLEQSVHGLEHGRVLIQYRRGTPAQRVAQLETLVGELLKGQGGYHTLLFENQSGMKPAVAATAWTQSLTCDRIDDRVWDAIRAFRSTTVDKGPEFIP